MHLVVSDHALTRWAERVGPADAKKIKRIVSHRLLNQLKLGLDSNDRGAFPLTLYPGLTAIDPQGYWVVRTFRRELSSIKYEVREAED